MYIRMFQLWIRSKDIRIYVCIYCIYYTVYLHMHIGIYLYLMLPLQVQLGDGAPMSIGDVDVQLNPIVIIVPAVVGGAVVISLLLVCCIVCCVCCQFKRKSKEKEKQVQNLLTHMELMESELADECRRGECRHSHIPLSLQDTTYISNITYLICQNPTFSDCYICNWLSIYETNCLRKLIKYTIVVSTLR